MILILIHVLYDCIKQVSENCWQHYTSFGDIDQIFFVLLREDKCRSAPDLPIDFLNQDFEALILFDTPSVYYCMKCFLSASLLNIKMKNIACISILLTNM